MRDLLPEEGKQYRACLHAHTTLSDGSLSPRELADRYAAAGYDILALTDHERPGELCGTLPGGMLILRGYECAFGEAGRKNPERRTCHLVLLAKSPAVTSPIPRAAETIDVYEPYAVSELLWRASDAGWYPILAHPFWSLEEPDDFADYDVAGVEIYNHLSALAGGEDRSALALEHFLRRGKFPLPIAADDCHDGECFGGFEMISAPSLSYDAVVEALEAGNAYASTGPLITSLSSEEGAIVFSCSAAREVRLCSDVRPVGARLFDEAGGITYGRIPFSPEASWVRLEVTDAAGRVAWTRAYLSSEL